MTPLAKLVLKIEADCTGDDTSPVMELPSALWAEVVKAARTSTPPRRRWPLALVACGMTKRNGVFAARDLYTGQLFQKARAAAELLADHWLILSAEHGVLHPDRHVRTYDKRLSSSKLGRDLWANDLGNKVALTLPRAGAEVLCLAGADYADALERNIPMAAPDTPAFTLFRPLQGLGIGEQLQRLAQMVNG